MSSPNALEAAIKSANINLDQTQTANALRIDRTFASRKRGRLAKVTSGQVQVDSPDTSLDSGDISAEISFWKDKYETLVTERSGREQDLEEQLKVVSEREAQLEKAVELLEAKIRLSGKRSSDSSENHSNDLGEVLNFYEAVTGMTVKKNVGKSNSYVCSVKNYVKRVAVRFVMTTGIDKSDDGSRTGSNDKIQSSNIDLEEEMEFEPTANVDLLPHYLRHSIEFDRKMAPVIMGDVLSNLYGDAVPSHDER